MEQFRQTFAQWLSAVKIGPPDQPFDPGEIKVGQLLSQLTTKQAWALVVVVFTVLAAVTTAAFKAGQSFPPNGKDSLQIIPAKQGARTAPAK